MKFLCFSDLHRDSAAAEKLVEASINADIVIGAGDFAIKRKGLQDTLEVLSRIEKPSIIVPGNGESFEELSEAAASWKQAHVLHGTGCRVEGIDFWGLGGGIPVTPFGDWSYDLDEGQAERLLRDCPEQCVLVVHSPPFDTVDHDTSGQIRGSRAIRAAVEQRCPRLAVCGHIHSDWGKQVALNSTLVVNAGPAGIIVEIDMSTAE